MGIRTRRESGAGERRRRREGGEGREAYLLKVGGNKRGRGQLKSEGGNGVLVDHRSQGRSRKRS
jgi:hypothetical protein